MNIDKPKIKELPKPKPYSKLTKREKSDLKRTIATQNKKIDRLADRGLLGSSSAYKHLEAMYEAGANYLYRDKNGVVKFKGNISKMSAQTLSEIKEKTRTFRKTKTSTIKGVKTYQKKLSASYNAMLKARGIEPKKPLKADDIRDLHESDAFKKIEQLYGYYNAVKIIEEHSDMKDDELIKLVEMSHDFNSDDIEPLMKLIDDGEPFLKIADTTPGLSRSDVEQLQLKYGLFDMLTPEQFQEYTERATENADVDSVSAFEELDKMLNYKFG